MPDLDRVLICLESSVSSMYWSHLENRLFFENVAIGKTVNKTNLIAMYFIALNNWPLEEVSEKLQAYQDRQQIVWAIILLDFKIIFQNQAFLLSSGNLFHWIAYKAVGLLLSTNIKKTSGRQESWKYRDPEDLQVQSLYSHEGTHTCCASVCTADTAFL